MTKVTVQNIVWKENKHYVAQCLNVDVSSFGPTKQEALVNLEEALELYFEDQPTDTITQVETPSITTFSLQRA